MERVRAARYARLSVLGIIRWHRHSIPRNAPTLQSSGAGTTGWWRRLPRHGRRARRRAREERRGWRRGAERGIPPGLSQLGRGLHRQPAQSEGDPRTGPGPARPQDRRASGGELLAGRCIALSADALWARQPAACGCGLLGRGCRAAAGL